MQSKTKWLALAAMIYFLALGQLVSAGTPDNLVTVVNKSMALNGGTSFATFAYDPANDSMFVSSFGAGANVSVINNVDSTDQVNNPTTESLQASTTEIQLFYRDDNPNRAVQSPIISGFLLNPQAIGDVPADSFAIITDAVLATYYAPNDPDNPNPSTTNTVDPYATKKVYSYNLGAADGDGNNVFTKLANLSDLQAAVGATSNTTNVGRQFAWSGDGQSIYFIDTTSASTSGSYGGIWQLSNLTSTTPTLTRIYDATLGNTSSNSAINTEPAVTTSGGVNSIYFTGGGTTGNVGGIDKVTHNLTTGATSVRQIAVSAATLADFFETTVANLSSIGILSMTSDANGDLFFNVTGSSNNRGIYEIDPQGRIIKVLGYLERQSEFGGTPGSNTLRMQTRTVSYTGTSGTFNVEQLLYAESSPINVVAGAYVFKPGDFNRDNLLNSADIALFKAQLTTTTSAPITVANADKLKYDLNGNNLVDWKDVKILQQYADFGNGDADMNGVVDNNDFLTLKANYGQKNAIWTQGDFTGDNMVGAKDFFALQSSNGYTSSVLTDYGTVTPINPADLISFINSNVRGDLTLDGHINVSDVQTLLAALTNVGSYETSNGLTDTQLEEVADVNGDGVINNADLQALLNKLLTGGGTQSPVPEPATVVLFSLGTLGLVSVRSKRRASLCQNNKQ